MSRGCDMAADFTTGESAGAMTVRRGATRQPAPPAAPDVRPPASAAAAAISAAWALAGTPLRLAARRTLFRQGEPADALYYIRSGKVRLSVVSVQGKEGVIAILGPGDFLGEGSLARDAVRGASAVAMSPSQVTRIDRTAMMRLIRHEPVVADAFLSFLLTRNAQIEADLIDHLFNSSERRLARVLLLLANCGEGERLEGIIPRISQEVLAAKVGTTRSRINFFMNKFRKLGLIEYAGHRRELKIHSSLLDVIVRD